MEERKAGLESHPMSEPANNKISPSNTHRMTGCKGRRESSFTQTDFATHFDLSDT